MLIYIKTGHSYPGGAPNNICDTMMPGHGVSSQQCQSVYVIQSNKSEYSINDRISIMVKGSTSSDVFRGFLLVAKRQTDQHIIGTWSVTDSSLQTLDCNGVAAKTGVTHVSNSAKSQINAIWYAPSGSLQGNIIIKATVVKTQPLIFVDCFSITLTPKQSNQSVNGTTRSTAATYISTSSSSSTSMAITTTTTTLATSDTGFNISWTYANGVTAVKMQINNLQASQWLAMGLSLDQTMGQDHVFVCQLLSDNTISLQRLINPSGRSHPVSASTISNPGGIFNITLQKFDNGISYCEFTLSNFSSSIRRRRQSSIAPLSQTTGYTPLIAIGSLDSSNNMNQHLSRAALSQTVQLNQTGVIDNNIQSTSSDQTSLMKAHGIIMIFTWILFVSTGILIARYFKSFWPNTKICGKLFWFAAHRAIMITAALLTIIAFVLIVVYEQGKWISQDTPREFAHSIVGIIVISLTIIQPIMALFRCKPDGKYRFIFNYIHATVGFSAFILSIVAIFLAMFFLDFNFESRKIWGIVVAWICWLPVIFIIFWFIEFHFRNDAEPKENTTEEYDLSDQNGNEPPKIEAIENVQKDRIKLIFLGIHFIVALGLALALAILFGTM